MLGLFSFVCVELDRPGQLLALSGVCTVVSCLRGDLVRSSKALQVEGWS